VNPFPIPQRFRDGNAPGEAQDRKRNSERVNYEDKTGEATMLSREKVENALQKVRPSLQADGGDVQLVDIDEDGVVKVKLMGACGGCPMSQMTLKMGIEKILKQNVPEVKRVESV
jgi:Fe-S cluster biogenesis protein NfuA